MEYSRFLEKWYVTDKSYTSIEEMSGSFDINALFADGNTYMMINGDWTFLLLPDANPDFTWAAAPLPIFEGTEPGGIPHTGLDLLIPKLKQISADELLRMPSNFSYGNCEVCPEFMELMKEHCLHR